jgi:hypothetical protein
MLMVLLSTVKILVNGASNRRGGTGKAEVKSMH